jgi:hypothetical protein
VLWFALVVIAIAGLTYVAFRYWVNEDLRHEERARRRADRDRRPWAPDDDDEFLRTLDRRHPHGDE